MFDYTFQSLRGGYLPYYPHKGYCNELINTAQYDSDDRCFYNYCIRFQVLLIQLNGLKLLLPYVITMIFRFNICMPYTLTMMVT